MQLFTPALLLALLPSTYALTCTASIARPWPAGGIAPSGSSGTSTCSKTCGNDSNCLKTCLELGQQGQCNSVGGSACPNNDSSDLISGKTGGSSGVDDLIKRATLECTSSEVCYMYTDNSLLCINLVTGNYHDDVGGRGNSGTGAYTSANGGRTTNLGDATATAATGASRTSSVRSVSTTSTSLTTSITSSTSASRTAAAASATSTPNNAAQITKINAIAGLVGLALACAL